MLAHSLNWYPLKFFLSNRQKKLCDFIKFLFINVITFIYFVHYKYIGTVFKHNLNELVNFILRNIELSSLI